MNKQPSIDNLDRKILSIVMHNARIPSKDVALVCGVSRAAVHQRIQRMIEDGIITGSGYTVNPKTECHFTTGPYTMLIKLFVRDNDHLMEVLNKKIQQIPGVTGTETLISLDNSIQRTIPMNVGL